MNIRVHCKTNDSVWHDNLSVSTHFSQVETLLQRQASKIRGRYGNEQRKCSPDSQLGVAALCYHLQFHAFLIFHAV